MDWITHEEDVWFEFRGSRPEQLSPGRFYRGTVDGFADFGVFVDIGDHVTGLLHESELETSLDSLDWEPGDVVFVQVTGVRDNGNVDLGWSIRQSPEEFRGHRIDDPSADEPLLPEDVDDDGGGTGNGGAGATGSDGGSGTADAAGTPTESADMAGEPTSPGGGPAESGDEGASESPTGSTAQSDASHRSESAGTPEGTRDAVVEPETGPASANAATGGDGGTATAAGDAGTASADVEVEQVAVAELEDHVGHVVAIEGEVVDVRQTSGPTVFTLRDETAAVECAAFVEAGVRAYPDVDADDLVHLEGEVERRRGELQVETDSLAVLTGEDRTAVEDRLEAAVVERATPEDVELLADHDPVAATRPAVLDAAAALRRAVIESRPVVIRHVATADGYAAGAALERALLPLVRDEHDESDAEYHYVERRPMDGDVYDMDAATDDMTDMLEARERHGEQLPLVALVGAGATLESRVGYRLLDLYGAPRVVVDAGHPDPGVEEHVSVAVNPALADADGDGVTSTALAANVAAAVNPGVRADLLHLPAVSYWEDAPDAYRSLAAEAGYDGEATRDLREAIALEAYYQSYNDKRELVADLLFEDTVASGDRPEGAPVDVRGLAGHIGGQFRAKLSVELESAERNLSIRGADGLTFAVLDADAFTHRFDFPPAALLLDALHRRRRDERDGPFVTVGVHEDELRLRSTEPVDVREVGERVGEELPDAGVDVVGGRDGRITFLQGEHDAVVDATVDAVAAVVEQ